MTQKSIICTLLYAEQTPQVAGRLVSFGEKVDLMTNEYAVNLRIIRFLEYAQMPCTTGDISLEIDENIPSTLAALKVLQKTNRVTCIIKSADLLKCHWSIGEIFN